MTEQANGGRQGEQTPQFSLQRIYVRDLSFEAPKSPEIFARSGRQASPWTLNTLRKPWKATSTKWC